MAFTRKRLRIHRRALNRSRRLSRRFRRKYVRTLYYPIYGSIHMPIHTQQRLANQHVKPGNTERQRHRHLHNHAHRPVALRLRRRRCPLRSLTRWQLVSPLRPHAAHRGPRFPRRHRHLRLRHDHQHRRGAPRLLQTTRHSRWRDERRGGTSGYGRCIGK